MLVVRVEKPELVATGRKVTRIPAGSAGKGRDR